MEMSQDTGCYTYEVTMVVQVLAPNKDIADSKLEQEGGFVSSRKVEFKNVVVVYSSDDE